MATGILRQYLAQNAVNPNRDAFGEGVRTGQVIRRGRERDRASAISRMIGGALASGDTAGARDVAYREGELETGGAISKMLMEQRNTAAKEKQAFAERFSDFAGGILQLPEDQREAAYRKIIPKFEAEARRLGIDFDSGPMDIDALRGMAALGGKTKGSTKLVKAIRNGKPVYVPESEAAGMEPASTSPTGAPPRFDLDITEVINPDGSRSYFRTTTDGRFEPVKMPKGARIAPKYQLKDTGTGFVPIDPGTGRPAGPEVPKTAKLAPDQRPIRGEGGEVVGAEAVPGSKLDIEQKNEIADKERKRLVREKMLRQAGRTVLRSITRALDDYLPEIAQGNNTLAATSRITQSKIPGTDEFNLVRQITDFQRNIGIDKLQQMRESSPTGGALGQVPVQQQIMLQETLGSFDIGQPPEVIKENLRQLNNIYLDIMFGSADERAVAMQEGHITPEQNAEIEAAYYGTEFNIFGRRGGGGQSTPSPGTQPQVPPDAAIQELMQNPDTADEFDEIFGEGAAQRILRGR